MEAVACAGIGKTVTVVELPVIFAAYAGAADVLLDSAAGELLDLAADDCAEDDWVEDDGVAPIVVFGVTVI